MRSSLVLAVGTVAVVVSSLTGCSDATPQSVPSPQALPVDEPVASTPGGPDEPPPARSGDLGREDLPEPSALGERWKYRVDLGDPEEGYQGSGEPAIAREPQSVLEAITPLGCRPEPLPVPRRALEVTYQRGPVPGVGLVLQFGSASAAQRFFAVHGDVLRTCSQAGRVNIEVLSSSPDTILSTRTEDLGHTPTWVEGVRLVGEEVTLIAVADPTEPGVQAVESALAGLASD